MVAEMCQVKPWEVQDLPAHWYQRVMFFHSARNEGRAAAQEFQDRRQKHYGGQEAEE